MSYIDAAMNLQDDEYRKALTYTAGNAAMTAAFGLASVDRLLDGDIGTAEKTGVMTGVSAALTKGLYNRVKQRGEELNQNIFEENSTEPGDIEYQHNSRYSAD